MKNVSRSLKLTFTSYIKPSLSSSPSAESSSPSPKNTSIDSSPTESVSMTLSDSSIKSL